VALVLLLFVCQVQHVVCVAEDWVDSASLATKSAHQHTGSTRASPSYVLTQRMQARVCIGMCGCVSFRALAL
jgi:hypothetical protein